MQGLAGASRDLGRAWGETTIMAMGYKLNECEKGQEEKEKTPSNLMSLEQNLSEKPPLDGGYSWIACVVGFFVMFVIGGQLNIAGIIFAALLDEYNTNRGQTAWVTAIASGSMLAFGMVSAVLSNRFGFANVIMFGGLTCAVGMFSSSFAPNIYALYLTYGLVWGFGSCLCYCSALFVLPRFFRERIGLANGIVLVGGSVGTLVLSSGIQQLINDIGLTKTFRVLAGIQLVLVISGFIARIFLGQLEFKNIKKTSFDWSIFKNKGYMTFVVSLCVFMPAYLIPYVHLVRLAKDSGVDSIKAAFLVSCIAFGSLTIRPFFGKLLDYPGVSRITTLQLTLLFISVSTALVPISTKYEWLATYAFLFGLLEGCFLISLPLIVQDLVGDSKLAEALGSLYCFISIPKMAGPSIAGWIYDTSNSYDVAFLCAGGIITVSTCILFIVPMFRTNSNSRSSSKGREDVHEGFECAKEKIMVKETRL